MDVISILILGSVAIVTIFMIVGPIMELKGKILFEKQNKEPVTKGRYGMGLMALSAAIFVITLVLRSALSAGTVTPFVLAGYLLWFVGGIVAVYRNELIKLMVSAGDDGKEGEHADGHTNLNN